MIATRIKPAINLRIWRTANAAILWLGLLLPWMAVDRFENINPLGMLLADISEIFRTIRENIPEGIVIVTPGILFIAGIALMVYFATIEWICVWGTSDAEYLKSNVRFAILLSGFVSVAIATVYFMSGGFREAETTGFFLVGYWFFWLGLISSVAFEVSKKYKFLRSS